MKLPTPKRLPSGMWRGQVQIGKKRLSVTEPTKQMCIDKALLLKAQWQNGLIPKEARSSVDLTLREAINNYILVRSNILSPSTIKGYKDVQKQRFKTVMYLPVESVKNWQAVVNNEAEIISPKTLCNAWSVAHCALEEAGVSKEKIEVSLPKIPKADRPWLEPEEIKAFLAAIKDTNVELPAILALHSLRRSEIYDLKKSDITKGVIRVRGATVRNYEGQYVHKEDYRAARYIKRS